MTGINMYGKYEKNKKDEDFNEQIKIPKRRREIKFNGNSLLNNPEGFNEKNMKINKKGMFGDCNMDSICGL